MMPTEPGKNAIGKNTADCLRSGIVFGYVGLVEGLLAGGQEGRLHYFAIELDVLSQETDVGGGPMLDLTAPPMQQLLAWHAAEEIDSDRPERLHHAQARQLDQGGGKVERFNVDKIKQQDIVASGGAPDDD